MKHSSNDISVIFMLWMQVIFKSIIITALSVGSVVAWIAFITLCVRIAQMWGWL